MAYKFLLFFFQSCLFLQFSSAQEPCPEGTSTNALTWGRIFVTQPIRAVIPTYASTGQRLNVTWFYGGVVNNVYPQQSISIEMTLAEKANEPASFFNLVTVDARALTHGYLIPPLADGNYVLRVYADGNPRFSGCFAAGFPVAGPSQVFKVINVKSVQLYEDKYKPNSNAITNARFAGFWILLAISTLIALFL